jgi:hypothetical protein
MLSSGCNGDRLRSSSICIHCRNSGSCDIMCRIVVVNVVAGILIVIIEVELIISEAVSIIELVMLIAIMVNVY